MPIALELRGDSINHISDSVNHDELQNIAIETIIGLMSNGLREILVQEMEQAEAKIARLTAETDERRRRWEQSANELEAARREAKQVQFLLGKLDEAVAQSAEPTIKDAVLEVLKHKPEGMTALEILDEINKRYFAGKYARTSLSPQLSRLKNDDKKVTLRGNRWHLIPEQPSLFVRRV